MGSSPTQPEPLGAIRYSPGAFDLARFVDDPVDDHIAALVRSVDDGTIADLEEVRAGLDAESAYVVVWFIKRRSLSAIRTGESAFAFDALAAACLLPSDKLDPRDIDVDLPLVAARRCGADPTGVLAEVLPKCHAAIRPHLEAAVARSSTTTLSDCMLVEVPTVRYGVGFVEDWVGADQPPVPLAARSVALADAIDAEGSYRIRDIRITDLPGVWFDGGSPDGDIESHGCTSLSGDHRSADRLYSHGLLVFAAEVGRRRAKKLVRSAASATTAVRPRRAWAVDDTVVLIIGGSSTAGEEALESEDSLGRFETIVRRTMSERH